MPFKSNVPKTEARTNVRLDVRSCTSVWWRTELVVVLSEGALSFKHLNGDTRLIVGIPEH